MYTKFCTYLKVLSSISLCGLRPHRWVFTSVDNQHSVVSAVQLVCVVPRMAHLAFRSHLAAVCRRRFAVARGAISILSESRWRDCRPAKPEARIRHRLKEWRIQILWHMKSGSDFLFLFCLIQSSVYLLALRACSWN